MLRSYLFITIAMLFFSGNFIAGKAFEGTISPVTLAFFRAFMGALVLLPLCWKTILDNTSLWKQEWRPLVGLSVTGIILFNVSLYAAVSFTSTINAAIVDALTPAAAGVLGFILLRERLLPVQNFGIVISFLGILWIITEGSIEVLTNLAFNIGDIIMFAGIICWALYSIIIKQHTYKFPAVAGLTMTMILGAVIMLPFALIESSILGFPELNNWAVVGGLFYIGIFPSAIALLLWYRGVGEIGPSKASVFFNLVPVFTTVLAVTLLGETFTYHQLFGGLVVLGGVYLSTKRTKTK
ncbi:DMT family transporter [Alkalicoccus daliensis]|uniref:Threonine/homoserine efflux transporter RhtA n=1 Tax=Alkalicoccus daliensis TaxID=745820 RepID=A0A1H0I8K7_9BACI|nr:DMT family transporter [Alkalicoccus daliensis]SDO27716.1 Threonine/homoserine efflux transporter RhtA [Alkalicoccus daliensis]